MKRAAIIYFSGTGNTKFIVDNMKSELEKRNITTDLINIEKDTILCQNYEFIVIGGPIYIDRYPEMLIKYLELNLKRYSKKCMLFSTQGSKKAPSAFQHVINRVQFLKVAYSEFIPMPNNFYNFMFKERTKKEEEDIISESIVKSRQAINNFIDGKVQIYHKNFLQVELVNIVYKMFYPYITRSMTRKVKIDLNKCSHCKLCEARCPNNCIHINNKVSFDSKCMLCQRCMNNCPNNAFRYKNLPYKKYKPDFKWLSK